jgi:hypothetical protein
VTDNASELKACPFCGAKAEFESYQPNGEMWVTCTDCCATSYVNTESDSIYQKEELVDAWNRRVTG